MLTRALALICWVMAATSVGGGAAVAQLVRDHAAEGDLRGFHGIGAPLRIKRSFQSDSEARAELNRILTAVGLNWISDRIVLRASAETSNAAAGIAAKGERFIFYNVTFMQKLKQKTAEHWSLVSVLAHELGHHLAFHNEVDGRWHEFELEANYFSGFVLRRLGATLDQAHAAMKEISPIEETPTHPGQKQRLEVISLGWVDGGGQGAPRGLTLTKPPADGAPATGGAIAPVSGWSAAEREWQQYAKDTTNIVLLEAFRAKHAADPVYNRLAEARIEALARENDAIRPKQPPPPMSEEAIAWSVVENSSDCGIVSGFAERYPNSVWADSANTRLKTLRCDRDDETVKLKTIKSTFKVNEPIAFKVSLKRSKHLYCLLENSAKSLAVVLYPVPHREFTAMIAGAAPIILNGWDSGYDSPDGFYDREPGVSRFRCFATDTPLPALEHAAWLAQHVVERKRRGTSLTVTMQEIDLRIATLMAYGAIEATVQVRVLP